MEEGRTNSQLRLNYKAIIFLLFFIIGAYLLIPRLVDIEEALRLILRINKGYLLLALAAEIISYLGAAGLMGVILSRLGHRIRFWDRFRLGSIAAFAIHFFPLGSFGEGTVDFYFLSRRQVGGGSILLMFVLRMIISYSAFLGLFFLALVLVPTYPHLPFSPKVISFFLMAVIIWGIFYMIHLYWHKEKFHLLWQKYLHFINRTLAKVGSKAIPAEKIEELFEDIYKGIGLFFGKKRTSVFGGLTALVYWLGDIFCFYFVFLSFGYKIGFGVLLFGYSVATLAGLVSFIPGGLGVAEGTMGLVYNSLGVPLSLALMSILVFRFFSFWIWIPFGLYSFLSLKRKS
ncbi:MAG TPA: lysylphosphatidylglycerol synthase transmembrane domain-containing protein [Patescibacteria group bacterium]|nr:lysylphosphatidylglycerol synthase transmembrane domain-containing protein [Patescibacteria group bacterium]